jgi:hypothetical protein
LLDSFFGGLPFFLGISSDFDDLFIIFIYNSNMEGEEARKLGSLLLLDAPEGM